MLVGAVVQVLAGRLMVQRVVDPVCTVTVPVGALLGCCGVTLDVKVIVCSLP